MKYGAIYADPPWTFATYSDKGKGRSAEQHYRCLSLADIKALPVADLAEDDAVLLLWITDPLLPRAFEVMEAWGFRYSTVAFYWVKLTQDGSKPAIGTGYWTRANPEQCLLGVRGHPKRLARNVPKVIMSPRREHSRKPDEARQRIMRLVPGPYVELFARERAENWSVALSDEPERFGAAA
jgi:N6-adenosine-specific RNA methylase IME4